MNPYPVPGLPHAIPVHLFHKTQMTNPLRQKIWWPFVKARNRETVLIVFLGFISSYCTLLLTLSIGKYSELVYHAGSAKARALQLLGVFLPDNIIFFFLFFFILAFLKFLCAWLYQYRLSLFGEAFVAALRKQLYADHRIKKKNEKLSASALLGYSSEATSVQLLLTKGVINFMINLMLLSMGLYVLFFLNAELTCFVFLLIVLFWFLHQGYSRRRKADFAEKRQRQGALLNAIAKSLLLEGNDKEYNEKKINVKQEKFRKSLRKYYLHKTLLRESAPSLLYVMLGIIMFVLMPDSGIVQMHTGDIITYILLLITLFPALRSAIRIGHIWLQGNLSARKFMVPIETMAPEADDKTEKGGIVKALFDSRNK
jgi:ABC-type multidrug transport system fused ATPase/permease subunit